MCHHSTYSIPFIFDKLAIGPYLDCPFHVNSNMNSWQCELFLMVAILAAKMHGIVCASLSVTRWYEIGNIITGMWT